MTISECSIISSEEYDTSRGDCTERGFVGTEEEFLNFMVSNLNFTDEERLSDYSEKTFTEHERVEYYDYKHEKAFRREQGLTDSDSGSSGSEVKIPKTSSILKYIFRSAVDKEKYKSKCWYSKKAVVREIEQFTSRNYQLYGDNQNERRKRLDEEMKKILQSVNKSVRVKDLDLCFQRLDEVGLRA